jgi:hypothetical protein
MTIRALDGLVFEPHLERSILFCGVGREAVPDCDICRRDEHRLRMRDHVEAVLSAVAPHRRRCHSHIRHPLPPERTFGSAKHLGENIQKLAISAVYGVERDCVDLPGAAKGRPDRRCVAQFASPFTFKDSGIGVEFNERGRAWPNSFGRRGNSIPTPMSR